jgi:DNA (cytosine-5)-methyltransferase 1
VTSAKPRLLVLFCGAGGDSAGYRRAGWYTAGVDVCAQPHYCGDDFVEYDALAVLEDLLRGGDFVFDRRSYVLDDFAAIHAGPPCQAYSSTRYATKRTDHSELIDPVRELLLAAGLPYVMENVPGAPLIEPKLICGTAVGLPLVTCRDGVVRQVRRHRLFETSFPFLVGSCFHRYEALGVYGHGPWNSHGTRFRGTYQGTADERRVGMEIDWMNRDEVSQAIPPAYAELIGRQLMQHVQAKAAA